MPSFVRDLVLAIKTERPELQFTVLAPHDPRSSTAGLTHHEHYDEVRFQYFWPRRLQLLAGRGGIVPSLQRNRLLFLLVPFFLVAERLAVRREIRRIHPDVVNAHWIIPQGVVVASLKSTRPLVLTIHGGDVFTFNNPVTVRLKRFALRAADRVVVNSSATYERTAQLGGQEIETIPMGVSIESFGGDTPRTPGPLRVLFVGRLSEEKGVADLLEAVAEFVGRGRRVEVRIAGTGPQASELHRQAQERGIERDVEFLGWVPRESIPELYAWADVFVGPSVTARSGWVEALGVVFIEASAAQLAVITTDAGGMRDVVLHERTGLIVPERAPLAIADALQRLDDDPALRMSLGEAGRAHVEAAFSWSGIARRYVEVLCDAAS